MWVDYSYSDGLRSFFVQNGFKSFYLLKKTKKQKCNICSNLLSLLANLCCFKLVQMVSHLGSQPVKTSKIKTSRLDQTKRPVKTYKPVYAGVFSSGWYYLCIPIFFFYHKTISIFLQKLHAGIIWFKVVSQPASWSSGWGNAPNPLKQTNSPD